MRRSGSRTAFTALLLVRLLRLDSAAAMRSLAGSALLFYCGFILPAVARRFALPPVTAGVPFAVAATFVLYWFWRAGRRRPLARRA